MKLKVANNLFIVGTQVISYETVVARIEGRQILVNGTYSRTTGKQIARLAQMTGFERVEQKVKRYFDEFHLGVQCRVDGAISPKGSSAILEWVSKGHSFSESALFCLDILIKKDREIVMNHLASLGYDTQSLEATRNAIDFLKEFELI
jgi:hypothetical protein